MPIKRPHSSDLMSKTELTLYLEVIRTDYWAWRVINYSHTFQLINFERLFTSFQSPKSCRSMGEKMGRGRHELIITTFSPIHKSICSTAHNPRHAHCPSQEFIYANNNWVVISPEAQTHPIWNVYFCQWLLHSIWWPQPLSLPYICNNTYMVNL